MSTGDALYTRSLAAAEVHRGGGKGHEEGGVQHPASTTRRPLRMAVNARGVRGDRPK
jgi:hypothetical protein